jgi:hypothetical protein
MQLDLFNFAVYLRAGATPEQLRERQRRALRLDLIKERAEARRGMVS